MGALVGAPPRASSVSEAELVRAADEGLSGPRGLTENHNTFARRHALAEIAGEFAQGASVTQLESRASIASPLATCWHASRRS